MLLTTATTTGQTHLLLIRVTLLTCGKSALGCASLGFVPSLSWQIVSFCFSSEADAPQKRERVCVFRTRLEIVELIVHDSRSACHHPVAVGDLIGVHRLRCSQSRDKAGRQVDDRF